MIDAIIFKTATADGELLEESFETSGPAAESLIGFVVALSNSAFDLTAEYLYLRTENEQRLEMFAREEREEDFNAMHTFMQRSEAFATRPVQVLVKIGRKTVDAFTMREGLAGLVTGLADAVSQAVKLTGTLGTVSAAVAEALGSLNADFYSDLAPSATAPSAKESAYAAFRKARPDVAAPAPAGDPEADLADELGDGDPVRINPPKAAATKKK